MKLSGHTLGTPNLSVEQSLRLFQAADMDAAVRTIAGSARSMGLNVEGV